MSTKIREGHQHLTQISEVRFTLSIVQQQRFNDYFAGEKQRIKEFNGDLYNDSTQRLPWACLRIAMVPAELRCMGRGSIPEKIECSDADFDLALSIIRTVPITATTSSTSSMTASPKTSKSPRPTVPQHVRSRNWQKGDTRRYNNG